MKVKFIEDPIEQDAQLFAWGLDRDFLVEAVLYARSFYTDCSSLDPLGFSRVITYARCGRRLRELHIPTRRWVRDDANNQTAIRNHDLRLRLHPCNLCGAAANPNTMPTNLSEKGSAAHYDTQRNYTPDLFGARAPQLVPLAVPQIVQGYKTLVLGMNFEGEYPKAEVSIPVSFMNGQYQAFTPRVPILDGNNPPGPRRIEVPDSGAFGEVDIPVKVVS